MISALVIFALDFFMALELSIMPVIALSSLFCKKTALAGMVGASCSSVGEEGLAWMIEQR